LFWRLSRFYFLIFFMPGFRLTAVKLLAIGIFLILIGKVAALTVFSGSYYRDLSMGNRIKEIVVPANRGVIYDRFGEQLAINAPAFLAGDKIISKEEALLNKNAQAIAARRYLPGPATAHVLGYINLADRTGVSGLEFEYNEILSGTDGQELIETNAKGDKLKSLGVVKPVDGENLTTTLALNLQRLAFEKIRDYKGAVVASDPDTGEILVLVSSPSFDPNLLTYPRIGITDEEVDRVLNDKNQPFFDRAVGATYPPGSTFKIITAAAGLESGEITSGTRYEDTGVLVIGPYKFPNWKWLKSGGTDGSLDIVGAIQKSNDIFFYQLGGKIGIEKITDMAKHFGLNQKLGIDLPGEAGGIVPDEKWRSEFARAWYLGDTYHLAIGQADLLVTPLQVNFWTAVMANGGYLCQPYINKNKSPSCKSLNLKTETMNLIKQGMEAACKPGGTAWPLFGLKTQGEELTIHCKTGTAEFGDLKDRTHAWLTAYVDKTTAAKFNKGPIAITVLLEGAGEGSDVAAPVVRDLLKEWFEPGN